MTKTLRGLIAPHDAALPAIGAPGREWMSFGALRDLSRAVEAELRARGIAASDRVAIVLPNGPEMATAFVTIAQAAATAPLNPAYRQEEYEFYLEDLKARALVVEEGYDGPALAAARKFGLGILRLRAGEGPAGAFTLHMEGDTRPAAPGTPGPDDVALILHTSGTTSRPKIVPLSQRNLAASAVHIRDTLRFTAADCGLNIMPLFHIHGLIAGVLAPLAAGSQVFCTPGFNALKFFGWMDEAAPTWVTAVPTMHQAILARAGRNAEIIERVPLRFLRSSSAMIAISGPAARPTVPGLRSAGGSGLDAIWCVASVMP